MNISGVECEKLYVSLFVIFLLAACSTSQTPEAPVDLDEDGVHALQDQCPSTPFGATVGRDGCPTDSDGDGVPDYLDECPDTLPGLAACAYGCELAEPIVINLVNDEFDFDKATLKPDMKVALDAVVGLISAENRLVDLTVVGHTDSVGTQEYNQQLSLRRAQAVVDYFRDQGLIHLKFNQVGRGESEPVDSNETAEGRANNRRVEIFSHFATQH